MKKRDAFEEPELILIIGDKKGGNCDKKFQKEFARRGLPFLALPLRVPKGHLKHALLAIRLMDAKGVYLAGSYRRIGRFFADKVADKNCTTTVVLRKKKYLGFDLSGCENIIEESVGVWGGA
jgi:hypothetical protein